MTRDDIARVAHEVIRAYCASLGDDSLPAWEAAPEWQKDSTRAVVAMHLDRPEAGPEASHEAWMAEKLAAGWHYGAVKDATAKVHPCLVPFADLPAQEKAKDYLFHGVVRALAGRLA